MNPRLPPPPTPPPTTPSTAATHTPSCTVITVRLRPRGEHVETPPAAPRTASGTPPRLEASPLPAAVSTPPSLISAGAVDGEMRSLRPRGETPSPAAPTTASGTPPRLGALPPPAAVSTPPPLVSAGAVDGETPASGTPPRLGASPPPAAVSTSPPLVSAGAVDGQMRSLRPRGELVETPAPRTASGTLPPPPPAAVSTPPPLVSVEAVNGEMRSTPRPAPSAGTRPIPRRPIRGTVGEGGLPPPLRMPTSRSEDIGRTAMPASAVPWADLPADLVLLIAHHLRLSRQDIERMRGVCPAWRKVIPTTLDPVLVLSRKSPDVHSEIILLEIKRSKVAEDAVLQRKIPLAAPPTGVSCWGSALGLIALQSHLADDREIFAYCICCARSKQMLSLPFRAVPKALFLEPLTPQRFVLMDADTVAESVLRVDSDGFPWAMEGGGRWWLPTPGFGDLTLKSMALSPGILRAGASRYSIIIIDESGRPMDSEIGVLELQSPPLYLPDGTLTDPWKENGRHLFLCDQKVYFVEIFDMLDAPQGVGLRLFSVEKDEEDEYALHPVTNIGNFSVYLGPNQSFAIPSAYPLIGRLANTVYIEDFTGYVRKPQVLAINIQSQEAVPIPFPEEVSALDEELMPAVWVGLPHQKDVVNHCRSGESWGFWD